MSTPRIAILGATGRMGRALLQAVAVTPALQLGAAIERAGHPDAGRDALALAGAGEGPVRVCTSIESCLAEFDVLVDFTRPEATLAAAALCAQHGKRMVVGTTGLSDGQRAQLAAHAGHIAICLSGNFSIGINLCVALVEQAARTLGSGFDVEVLEAHHRHKVDAPSGTALMLGEAAARGAGAALKDHAIYARQGQTGARPAGAIGFQAIRGGDVIGDHTVMFLGEGERIEISHRATSRANFANGAMRAAGWIADRLPGLYSMRDVLRQNETN
ncbi:MAG TPA: 4-hydroxy-tetrahydrodipicolinate reductase [Solimonas sp.]|nr:4-hydroxy-tetrahydrodipicolinate reductase [Solimonas sp.]